MVRSCLLLVSLAALAACSSAAPPAVAEGDEHIACALAGAAEYKPACSIERARQDNKLFLVVRHPDGAFRRFEVVSDGRGLAVADGAEEASVALSGKELEVTVGTDRYRFPATAKADDARP